MTQKLTFDAWVEEYVNKEVFRKNLFWFDVPLEEILQPLYEEYLKE